MLPLCLFIEESPFSYIGVDLYIVKFLISCDRQCSMNFPLQIYKLIRIAVQSSRDMDALLVYKRQTYHAVQL